MVREKLSVDHSSEVPLEAPHRVLAALAGFTFSLKERAGTGIVTNLGECDCVYGPV